MPHNKIIKTIEQRQEKLKEEKEKLDLLETFKSYEGKDEVITSKEAWEELEREKKPVPKFQSKIPTLDKLLDGFMEGELVVVSGITKHGKTSFCQSLTNNFAEQGINCLWFSYELPPKEFLRKFKEPLPYFLIPKNLADNSLEWIETRIVEAIAKYGVKIVFIDHLHFLLDLQALGRGNISGWIGFLMRQLKNIARQWDVCIVIICHTTKLEYDIEPNFSDIRDSSFICQESDLTLMIYRLKEKGTNEYINEAKLTIQANRRTGKTGSIYLVLKDNQFYEKAYRQ